MASKKTQELEQQNWLIAENLRYRVWMTFLFWTGVGLIALKEWRKATWEDAAGAWSALGLIAYAYWKYRAPKREAFPPRLVWWRVIPVYLIAAAALVETVVRYLGGREDPPAWVFRAMHMWRLEPDGDWLGVALAVVLCFTIFAREYCFTDDPA